MLLVVKKLIIVILSIKQLSSLALNVQTRAKIFVGTLSDSLM